MDSGVASGTHRFFPRDLPHQGLWEIDRRVAVHHLHLHNIWSRIFTKQGLERFHQVRRRVTNRNHSRPEWPLAGFVPEGQY